MVFKLLRRGTLDMQRLMASLLACSPQYTDAYSEGVGKGVPGQSDTPDRNILIPRANGKALAWPPLIFTMAYSYIDASATLSRSASELTEKRMVAKYSRTPR